MLLLKAPRSREEILYHFKNDAIVEGFASADSITNTINTLRKAGCIINRPSKKTDFKYILESHPFSKILTKENIDVLQTIRDSVSTLGDWKLLTSLNNLYSKLSKYVCDEESKDTLLYNHNLKNIDNNILKEIINGINSNAQLSLTYYSPKRGRECFEFNPKNIVFESNKLYLWGYTSKFKDATYLRIDRIKNLNFTRICPDDEEKKVPKKSSVQIVYKLKNLSAIMYLENNYEEIISQEQDDGYSLTIRAVVENKFNFFQRILSYGTDCKIISPKNIITEYKEILSKIKRSYEDAQ